MWTTDGEIFESPQLYVKVIKKIDCDVTFAWCRFCILTSNLHQYVPLILSTFPKVDLERLGKLKNKRNGSELCKYFYHGVAYCQVALSSEKTFAVLWKNLNHSQLESSSWKVFLEASCSLTLKIQCNFEVT